MGKAKTIWKRLGAFLKFDLPVNYDSIRELFLQIHTSYREDYPRWSTRATRRKAHIHVVTTNIQKDGRRIDMQNIGRNQSEQARKAIEQLYGLVKAEDHKRSQPFELKINAQKVEYGKSPTKRAIMNVLDRVIDQYKFASLPELNAILQQYNVLADRGQEDSRTFKNGGLVYRVLDENGLKIGVPIKASDFYNKPTLKNLERKFEKNKILRVGQKQPLKKIIDRIMMEQGKMSLAEFRQELERKGIQTVIRQNEQGLVYGITYIDQRTKCVFNGSDLGKEYSAKRILERCAQGQVLQKSQNQSKPQPKLPTHKQHPEKGKGESSTVSSAEQDYSRSYAQSLGMQRAVEILLQTQEQYGGMAFDPKRKKRRKNVNYKIVCNGWRKKIISFQVAIPYAETTYKLPSNKRIFRKFVE